MKAKRLVSAVLATAMAFSCAVSASAANKKIGEYDVVSHTENGKTTLIVFRYGDVNGDDKINVSDIVLIAAANKGKNMDKYKAWMIRADVDFNERVDQADIDLIAAYIKGKK